MCYIGCFFCDTQPHASLHARDSHARTHSLPELKIKKGGTSERAKLPDYFSPFSKHSDVLMDATDEEMDGEGLGALNLKCLKLIPPIPQWS